MHELSSISRKNLTQKLLGRRNLIRGAGTAVLGAGILSKPSFADEDESQRREGPILNPIPGGIAPFAPFGVLIHHNPLNPAVPLADINDPSQITDFDGFVGLTHIRGGGTGTDTGTGAQALAYQADMGFAKGKFIGTDGRRHRGTFAFV